MTSLVSLGSGHQEDWSARRFCKHHVTSLLNYVQYDERIPLAQMLSETRSGVVS